MGRRAASRREKIASGWICWRPCAWLMRKACRRIRPQRLWMFPPRPCAAFLAKRAGRLQQLYVRGGLLSLKEEMSCCANIPAGSVMGMVRTGRMVTAAAGGRAAAARNREQTDTAETAFCRLAGKSAGVVTDMGREWAARGQVPAVAAGWRDRRTGCPGIMRHPKTARFSRPRSCHTQRCVVRLFRR